MAERFAHSWPMKAHATAAVLVNLASVLCNSALFVGLLKAPPMVHVHLRTVLATEAVINAVYALQKLIQHAANALRPVYLAFSVRPVLPSVVGALQ